MGKLDGRVAAITGGTAGIGRGIAEAFLAEGASVSLNGRNKEKGDRVLAELDAGDRAVFIAGDVMNGDDIDSFIDQTREHFGHLDILVNNAGGAAVLLPTVDMPFDDWETTIRWNLHSTFIATKRALPGMIEQGWGRIINISSVEGKVGKPVLTAYVAAKHGIIGLTKGVAREVGTTGVTVNALCPGLVITDIVKENGPNTAAAMGITFDEMVDLFAQESSIKRPNTVEEVANAAVMLACDLGAGITGAAISVDGGTSPY
ncbi:MAG TPA: SDR family NAD(P)-dependent oxidoreductase [Jatrophihabitans sp.]|nr:SDR family NAD(P)-dependent oxidoreductase [Jatrophihabitans sp.]